MSEANVELVRHIFDAWTREQSAAEFIADEVEYVNPPYAVEPGTRRGRAGFAMVGDIYEDFELEVERFIDAGEDEVVVLAHYSGKGRGSGVPVSGEQGYVWTVREGKAVRFQWFQSHAEALAAAGLAGPDDA